MKHFPIDPRSKRTAQRVMQAVHTDMCPVMAAHPDQRIKAETCGCSIGIAYRALCELKTEQVSRTAAAA